MTQVDDVIRAILASPLTKEESPERQPAEDGRGTLLRARADQRRLVARLSRCGRESDLADHLAGCTRRRCGSAECPACTFELQKAMVSLHRDFREGGVKLDACLTIIPRVRIAESGGATESLEAIVAKIERFRQRLHKSFDESGITMALGALDFTAQEFANGEYRDHVKPHLHVLAFHRQVDGGRRILNGYWRPAGSVNRPVQVLSYDGSDAWVRYMFRTPDSRTIRRRDTSGRWMDATYRSLTVDQQLFQVRLLHELGWSGRLFFHGIDLIEGHHGWRFAMTNFTPAIREKSRRRN